MENLVKTDFGYYENDLKNIYENGFVNSFENDFVIDFEKDFVNGFKNLIVNAFVYKDYTYSSSTNLIEHLD